MLPRSCAPPPSRKLIRSTRLFATSPALRGKRTSSELNARAGAFGLRDRVVEHAHVRGVREFDPGVVLRDVGDDRVAADDAARVAVVRFGGQPEPDPARAIHDQVVLHEGTARAAPEVDGVLSHLAVFAVDALEAVAPHAPATRSMGVDAARVAAEGALDVARPVAVIRKLEQSTRERCTRPVSDAFGFALTNCSPLSTSRTR